jgi:hypothetical protein
MSRYEWEDGGDASDLVPEEDQKPFSVLEPLNGESKEEEKPQTTLVGNPVSSLLTDQSSSKDTASVKKGKKKTGLPANEPQN